MRVNIADLKLEEGGHKTVPIEVTLEPIVLGGQGVGFEKPFVGKAEIWNTGDKILVEAKISGEALLECSRCLTAFTLPVRITFEEEFREGEPQDEVELEEESQRTLSYYQGDEIDLSEAIRDNVLLELPMKPVCRPDCEGLCQICGTNQNERHCGCQEIHDVDPRMAKLKDLLQKPDHNA